MMVFRIIVLSENFQEQWVLLNLRNFPKYPQLVCNDNIAPFSVNGTYFFLIQWLIFIKKQFLKLLDNIVNTRFLSAPTWLVKCTDFLPWGSG